MVMQPGLFTPGRAVWWDQNWKGAKNKSGKTLESLLLATLLSCWPSDPWVTVAFEGLGFAQQKLGAVLIIDGGYGVVTTGSILGSVVCDWARNSCSTERGYYANQTRFMRLTLRVRPLAIMEITYSLTYGAEPFFRSHQLCSHSRTSQHFVEPEGSSSCSQEPSNGPYPESDQPSPHHSILYLRSI
jgi:hypothetical protein